MLIYAPKEVRSSVHIQHDLFPFVSPLFPRIVIPSHLNPLRLQYSPFPPPLPPFTSSYPIDAFMTQLCNESVGRCCNRDLRYGALVHFNPAWMRDPLGGEALDVFDGMKGGVAEELTDQAKTFMIGDVSSGPLSEGFPVQILGFISVGRSSRYLSNRRTWER